MNFGGLNGILTMQWKRNTILLYISHKKKSFNSFETMYLKQDNNQTTKYYEKEIKNLDSCIPAF